MTEALLGAAWGFWAALAQMAPYLLFGFAVAGVLSVLVSPEAVERHLGGGLRPWWAVVKAALFGVPLPLCSCGVIPVAASLRSHGASRGATISFLISTPQTGVDSILVTYSFLGPVFTVFRVLAAFLSGIVAGIFVGLLEDAPGDPKGFPSPSGGVAGASTGPLPVVSGGGTPSPETPGSGRWKRGGLRDALRYGFVTLPGDIGSAMLVGLAIAGLIAALLPPHFFHELLGPLSDRLGPGWASFASMLVMMAVGIPTYVCATASVPIAAALMGKGVSAGAALVFLMTGPATNAATVAMVWKVMGRRTAWIYLAAIGATALASGLALDVLQPRLGAFAAAHLHREALAPGETLSGLALLAVLAAAVAPRWLRRLGLIREASGRASMTSEKTDGAVILAVSGMTCSHCAASVEKALSGCEGVESAHVDLAAGKAVVRGAKAEAAGLIEAVAKLGYSAAVLSTPIAATYQ
ncbi:MAG: SO_0444 family Cu/Zn efflux transporter [Elusimicrobia bacterium]|nr:SO_0444 family Cu/Zn efflux transporter [Elusimicrobiota bacterium]